MDKYLSITLVAALSAGLTGCWLDGSSSDSSDSTPTTNVTVIHAASDAPRVNVRSGDTIVVPGADYKQAASLEVPVGSANLSVDAILPGGDLLEVIGPLSPVLEEGIDYDVIALGNVGDDTLDAILLADDGTRQMADSARVRVAHLASLAPEVDVYVSAPNADLTGVAPTITFAFPTATDPIELPAGDYQIRITIAGQDVTEAANVAFDSRTVPLPAGSDLLIGAVNNTGFGQSPVSLVVENGGEIIEIFDAEAGVGLKAVHNAFDAGLVDIEVAGTVVASGVQFTEGFPGLGLGAYAAIPANEEVDVSIISGGTPVITETVNRANGSAVTALASGSATATSLELIAFDDNNRPLATAAKLRVIHGASAAPNVDVYLVPADANGIGNASPVLSDVPYRASSGYLELPTGEYDVYVTAAGASNPVIDVQDIALKAGGVYTALARDADGTSFELLGLDNLAVPVTPGN
ncbi:DUF4397 domain-containing protein [Marinobacter changyiensis]|uniref:DUF4397 domain-containing protein n=1 Tax=Marinobacter changyiensis TaxID=2604091 RepID=UPI0012652DB5|nr:DUF4397 domain-containing protein [Marinobacter changyiensis]